jgi:PKD repeat protein
LNKISSSGWNRYIYLIMLALIGVGALVTPVSADAFSAWSSVNGCWTATNSTHTLVMWNTTGTSSWSVPSGVTNVSYLVVAGGGAGGGYYGGGGGAGGVLSGTGLGVSGFQSVIVGAGGVGNSTNPEVGGNGGYSIFSTINATGGGGGATARAGSTTGRNGGSGGGGAGGLFAGGTGISGQGYRGGYGVDGGSYGTGGGGGNASVGANGTTAAGGNGGDASYSNITGTRIYLAGGGGGSVRTSSGHGVGGSSEGNKVGGDGGDTGFVRTVGVVNTGSGGGGEDAVGAGADGGSGIVIISYQTPPILAAPVANFTTGMVANLTPNMWNFNDTTTNTPASWNWSFGDGQVASTQNVTHLFATAGNYTINLTVTNTGGSNTSIKYQQVYVQANYTVVFFNNTGVQSWVVPVNITSVDYLVIGGGGAGASTLATGGGGAGGVVYNTSVSVTPLSSINVTVGSGGVSTDGSAANGENGWESRFNTALANGGGGGGYGANGLTGGSGGGASYGAGKIGGTSNQPTTGLSSGIGNAGGNGADTTKSGGGGGAGSVGLTGAESSGGYGGNGLNFTISGSSASFAAGGGGSGNTLLTSSIGIGGSGIGGNGSAGAIPVTNPNGVNGTGSGGGAGYFNVTARAGGNGGTGIVIIRYLSDPIAPVANFTKSNSSGYMPLLVNFTDVSNNTPTSWNWSFTNITGNGTQVWFSQSQNPNYIFGAGNWSIRLNATNSFGTNTSPINVSFVNVTGNVTVANFTKSNSSGFAPLVVNFTDTSSDTPFSWNWSYTNVTGNETEIWFSQARNPTYIFGSGNWSIRLNVTSSTGSSITPYNTSFVNVTSVMIANFTSNTSVGYQSPYAVSFTDTTTDEPVSWNWSFGDGRYNNTRNPSYVYYVANNYTVMLNVTNSSGKYSNVSKYVELRTDDDAWLKSRSHFNSSPIIDEKGNAWVLSSDAAISTVQKKFGAASLAIITDEDRATSVSASTWNLSSTNWQIEFWIYPVSQGNTAKNIISRTTGTGSGTTSGWGFRNNGSTTGYSFWMGNVANETPRFTLSNNVWQYVKIYRDGGNVEIYKDGTKVVQSTYQLGSYDIAQPIVIGVQQAGADNYFYIDEFGFTQGISREVGNTTTPYAEYNGNLYQNYININENATLRYKTNPEDYAVTYNQTGARYRTVQIQNLTNATMINGTTNFLVGNMIAQGVGLNNTVYGDMVLNSYSIDNENGIVSFSVSRSGGIKALFNNRTDLVDIPMLYYNYTTEPSVLTYFGSGFLTDGQNNVSYPITKFIGTNVSLGEWNFTSNFTANSTYGTYPLVVQFNDTGSGFPTTWNWSFGDGNWTNTTDYNSRNVTYTYNIEGLYNVTLFESLYQNTTIQNTSTRLGYINVTGFPPVVNFTSNTTLGERTLGVQFNDTSVGDLGLLFNWSFGDGNYSTTRNATYAYNYAGLYTVNLTVYNGHGTNSTSKVNYMNVTSIQPVANFVANSTIGSRPLVVQFNDTSVGDLGLLFNWSFGDGNYSTTRNATYSYTGIGLYRVNLTVSNSGGSNTKTVPDYISVFDILPVSSFSPNASSGYYPMSVKFTDTSSGYPASWNWSFGDGNYSIQQSPTYTYNYVGNYVVNLSVYNTFGNTTSSSLIQVNSFTPATNFVANNTYGQIPVIIQFTDQTVNSPVSWNWSFGDGTYSNSQNPLKVYSTVGIFNVTLNTTNVWGYNSMTRSYYITAVDPVPKPTFIENATAGVNPLAIQFNDTTSGGITGWNWSFGDGYYSGDSRPIHVYTNVGTYTVTLTVVSSGGSNSTTKTNYIHLITTPFPLTDFSANPTTGVSPMNVQFTDLTSGSGIYGWNWSFGDGTFSNLQNPLKTYTTTGQYTVTLMATNGYGSNGTSRVNYINVNIPTSYVYPAFSATPTSGNYGVTNIQFTDNSVCNPSCTAWSWDFNNDGAIESQLQNPSYIYPAAGTYSPKLIVTNGVGSGTKILQSYIQINPIYVPTTIPQPTVSWTPGYSDANGSFVFRGADMSTDIENSTYLKYWLPNFTQSGNFSLYGFGFSIMAPTMHVFGFWIFLIIWALYLFAVWVRSQDVTMPVVIGILSIGVMGVLFPKESLPVLIIMFAICIAVILTKLLKD